jgi:hypothetical protein
MPARPLRHRGCRHPTDSADNTHPERNESSGSAAHNSRCRSAVKDCADVVMTLGPRVAQRAEHNDGRQGANGERPEGERAGRPRAGEVVLMPSNPSSAPGRTDTHEPSTTRAEISTAQTHNLARPPGMRYGRGGVGQRHCSRTTVGEDHQIAQQQGAHCERQDNAERCRAAVLPRCRVPTWWQRHRTRWHRSALPLDDQAPGDGVATFAKQRAGRRRESRVERLHASTDQN